MGDSGAAAQRGSTGSPVARMSFWSENYSFIKDVYDTRVSKMIEWMDHVEMAIQKVMATKAYTSAEFKRERDNFLSLIKNMEKADTKKWLDEVKETLFRDRAGDERKDEYTRLEAVIEKHQGLIPRVLAPFNRLSDVVLEETAVVPQVKT